MTPVDQAAQMPHADQTAHTDADQATHMAHADQTTRARTLSSVGSASPVFQMIGGADTADGAVCGIDGVCVVPGSVLPEPVIPEPTDDSSTTSA